MSLLEVLSDRYVVCRNRLFSFLDVEDFLRLRRVSKAFKDAAEDFIRTKNVNTNRSLNIDFATSRPFKEYFKFHYTSMFLPQRKSLVIHHYMHNRVKYFSMRRLLECFLNTCGTTNITSLSILGADFDFPLHSKRLIQLFDSFPNVTHLSLHGFLPFDVDDDEDEDLFASRSESALKEVTIPTGFKKLKYLMLSPSLVYNDTLAARKISFAYCVKFVGHYISNLEYLSIPFDMFLCCWEEEREVVMRFACMCLFNDYNVQLGGVEGSFIEELLETNGRTPEMGTIEDMACMINSKVNYIFNPKTKTFLLELPNLTSVLFETYDYCEMPNPGFVRPKWPKLASIDVKFKAIYDWNETVSFSELWNFLFVGIVRENLVYLHIGFKGFDDSNSNFSRTTDILASCPNLKDLTLNDQINEIISLPELWNGLQRLEYVYFSGCSIHDADFIGNDESSPALWNLKRLKWLDFAFMENMMVTDKLFSKVLCHMPLEYFSVHSKEYVDSITLDGIKSLLNGKFATTIEKLDLNLAGVSCDEQDSVMKLFRSSQMI